MKIMVVSLVAIAALVGIALIMRKRTVTTTVTAKPPGSAPVVTNASGQEVSALNWLTGTDSERAAALARMQADPTDQEWFHVMDIRGNPTGNVTYETLAQATAGASAAATKIVTDNAARLAEIAALNKLSAVIGMQPLAMTAMGDQIATYRAEYLNSPNLPSNRSSTSLGWLGGGLNAIGSAFGAPKLGTAIQGVASLST
jgi:hypothetical protein